MRQSSLNTLRLRLIWTDAVTLGAASLIGLFVSSRASAWAISPLVAVYAMPFIITALWLGMLAVSGAYDRRIIGIGQEEVRRLLAGTVLTFAVVAGVSYLFRADISRAYAFVSLPLGLALAVIGRFAWRGWLYRRRQSGDFLARTVVVGSGDAIHELEARFAANAYAGFAVVDRYDAPLVSADGLDAWVDGLTAVLSAADAQSIAFALSPSDPLSAEAIRETGWRVEGRGMDLLIAPAILDVGGPRLSIRPAAGLALLHLDEATLSRSQAFTKRALDLSLALALLIIMSPVLMAAAVAIRLNSRGPVVFRQRRVGRGGEVFTILKFRTMVVDADSQRAALREQLDPESATFKMDDDPRVTGVGRFLRRWSIDELPQLVNVVAGSMSLVGPRPHPLDDVDRYRSIAFRRLALKPGLTGLWQVSGRSDLSWVDGLALDLYYVETWSLASDLVLLARTCRAVLQGRGAR